MDRSVKQSTSKEASDNIGQQDDNRAWSNKIGKLEVIIKNSIYK